MKLWVDDERPAPEGWAWAKTVQDAITALLAAQAFDVVEEMSLDYTLGRGESAMDLLEWMRDELRPWPPVIHAHSSSYDGQRLIRQLVDEWRPPDE